MESPELDRESVRSQLERILASPEFVSAGRLSRFLRFTVEKAAGGQSDQLKEYVIGTEVYERGASYDPRIDAIVRVEAGRLRARLQRYYDKEGLEDPVVISMPKGSYAPVMLQRSPPGVSPEPPDSHHFRRPVLTSAFGWPFFQPLKGWKSIVLLAILLSASLALYWMTDRHRRESSGTVRNPSIAVLPLENLSADPEQEYFSDGMTDALITDLANIRGLRVISRTSAVTYKKTKKPLRDIARELGVDYVVEGTVQRVGERVRITAQLIAAAVERHVWAESYERDLRDVLALQAEVARVIAREVRVRLTPQDQARLASVRPVNRDAFEAYLKGRYFQSKRTKDGLNKSVQFFQEAVAKDPAYARAYSGLADSFTYLANHGFRAPREAGPQAKAAAGRALEIDDTLAEAHTSRAYILMVYDWDWPGAEKEFRRSIDLDPSYAKAHSLFACYFALQRRFDEALVEIRRAVELDPVSIYDNSNLGWHLQMARRYDESIKQYRRTLDMDPGSVEAHWGLGRVLEQKKVYDEAIAEFQRAVTLAGDDDAKWAALVHAYAQAGRLSDAHKALEQLRALSNRNYVSSYEMAVAYAGLGKKSEAFAWLNRAFQERDGGLWLWVNLDPRFDSLRSEPRFNALLKKMNLPH